MDEIAVPEGTIDFMDKWLVEAKDYGPLFALDRKGNLIFYRDGEEASRFSWEQVLTLVGHLGALLEQLLYPAQYIEGKAYAPDG